MKKYTYTIIFILFNLAFVYSFLSRGDEDDIPVFLEEEYYQVYNIEYDDGITINRYKEYLRGLIMMIIILWDLNLIRNIMIR